MGLTKKKQDVLDGILSTNNNKTSKDSNTSVFYNPETGESIAPGYQNIQQPSDTERELIDKKHEELFKKEGEERTSRVTNIMKAFGEGGDLSGFNLSDDETRRINLMKDFPKYMSEYKEGDDDIPWFQYQLKGDVGRDYQAFKAANPEGHGSDEDYYYSGINPNSFSGLRGLSDVYQREGFDVSKGSDLDKAISTAIGDRSVFGYSKKNNPKLGYGKKD